MCKKRKERRLPPPPVARVCVCVCVCVCTQWCPSRCNPMDCNPLAPLSMGFFRQEYWSGLPFPSPGDLPDLGTESVSPASPALTGGFFTTKPPGKLKNIDGSWVNGESLVMAFCLGGNSFHSSPTVVPFTGLTFQDQKSLPVKIYLCARYWFPHSELICGYIFLLHKNWKVNRFI